MSKSSFFLSPVENSSLAYQHLQNHISYEQEEVWIIGMNSLKKPINTKKIFIGSVDQSLIHPREIFRELILSRCSSYILCHSHPSGDPSPSSEDLHITKRFKKLSDLLQIYMDDHIIFSEKTYFSFLDGGLLS